MVGRDVDDGLKSQRSEAARDRAGQRIGPVENHHQLAPWPNSRA